jgi:transposase
MSRSTRAQWTSRVQRWRESGRQGGAFAAQEGVKEKTLRWWAWRLEREGVIGGVPSAASAERARRGSIPAGEISFVQLTPAPAASATDSQPLEVMLSNGRVLRVPANFDSASLLRVVAALDGGLQ